jgi:hypothetical protein
MNGFGADVLERVKQVMEAHLAQTPEGIKRLHLLDRVRQEVPDEQREEIGAIVAYLIDESSIFRVAEDDSVTLRKVV